MAGEETEKLLLVQYGQSGLKIFKLIDGQKTVIDIAHHAKVNPDKVLEVIRFLEDKGAIRLDYSNVEMQQTTSLTLSLPSNLYERMKLHNEVNWDEFAARMFEKYLNSIGKGTKKASVKKPRKTVKKKKIRKK